MNSIFSCSFPKPALQSNSTEKKTPLNSSRTAAARKAAMISLNCLSINRPQILASALPTNNTTSQSLPNLPPLPSKPSNPTIPPLPKLEKTEQKQRPKKRQPSVLEIERAIGAGIFRDRDPDSEENLTLFDKIFLKSVGKTEGSVEKQLRETGEWIGDRSEKTFRSAAKPILMFVFQWVFPVWICGFLIASGIIKLPFNSPFLDDLIM